MARRRRGKSKAVFWLQLAGEHPRHALGFPSRAQAVMDYRKFVLYHRRVGTEPPEATITISYDMSWVPADGDAYPDWVLSTGPRGGIKVQIA